MALDSTRSETTYLNDPESAAELARLIEQGRLLTDCMGGLFPEQQGGLNRLHDVLDVACGPGGWALEVASAYPQMQVTGFDISRAMIEYARLQASSQHLENVRFEVLDATSPLPFADASFDLVNARTIASFMRTSAWPNFLGECVRILRPGGILRLTETDHWGVSNKPAFERLMASVYRAVGLTGHSFDPSLRTFGVTPMLERLMRLAGLQEIHHVAHAVNYSSGFPAHHTMYENFRVFFQLFQPFELKVRATFPEAGIPDQGELERLYEQMFVEMRQDDFVSLFYLLTAWGQKPR